MIHRLGKLTGCIIALSNMRVCGLLMTVKKISICRGSCARKTKIGGVAHSCACADLANKRLSFVPAGWFSGRRRSSNSPPPPPYHHHHHHHHLDGETEFSVEALPAFFYLNFNFVLCLLYIQPLHAVSRVKPRERQKTAAFDDTDLWTVGWLDFSVA